MYIKLSTMDHRTMKTAQLWFISLILPWANWTHGSQEQTLVVRKCCAENEYFNSTGCEIATGSNYVDRVRTLLTDASTNITYKTGNITMCPNYGQIVEIPQVTPQNHAIIANGRLQEIRSGVIYDHANYCMEFKASSPEELGGTLIARVCPMIRSFCYLNQDHATFSSECQESFGNISHYSERIHSFLDTDLESQILPNEISKSLKIIKLNETYPYVMSGTVLLCDYSDYCHPISACCKVLVGDGRGAFICQNSFNKCCPSNEIWTDDGCLSTQMHRPSSSHMATLIKSYFPQIALPKRFDETCKTIFKSADEHISWSTEGSLTLSVQSDEGIEHIYDYCIEDYEDETGALDVMVMLCLRNIAHILSRENLNKYDKGLPIGKCYREGLHFNEYDGSFSNTLKQPASMAANITELTYTDFPKCKNREPKYIPYVYGKKEGEDYAVLLEDQTMGVVVIDEESGCNFTIDKLRNTDYCIGTYSLNESTSIQIFICSDLYVSSLKHQERYIVLPVLMVISIAALVYTIYFLFSLKVRRGIITEKKVNTLAGRILLSYVISYLLTFLLLSIGMIVPIPTASVACPLLAGSTMFFMLAAFLWNTSVCVEYLLFHLTFSVSEKWRLLWHCLWAWGTPGLITAVALTLDHYRADLECAIATPKVGLNRCFFSDTKAQLLYLYTPMCISLVANVILITAVKLITKANLRQFEQGKGIQHSSSNQHEGKIDGNRQGNDDIQQSGLRKFQNRNVWVDSAKLVFWATWILEVVAFLITYYQEKSYEDKWYAYLWYFPVAINALRVVGIFYLQVFSTPEFRKKISKFSINCPWFPWLTKKSQKHSKGVTSQTIPRHTSTSYDQSSMISEPETTVTRL